jgi:hypothetical protein
MCSSKINTSSDIKLKSLIIIGVFISFFVTYTGHAFFLYPLFVLYALKNISRNLIKITDVILILIVVMFYTVKMVNSGFGPIFTLVKYYFGFLVFYVFFRQQELQTKINIDNLLLCIAAITILEAILINTIIPPEIMPNFPDLANPDLMEAHKTKLLGFYTRPYSVGANSSITSSIIVTLMMLRLKLSTNKLSLFNITEVLSVVAVLVSCSGTGYLLLLLYFLLRSNKTRHLMLILLLLALIYLAYFFYNPPEGSSASLLYKVSPVYITALLEFKISQFIDQYNIFSKGAFASFFGMGFQAGDNLPIMSDFGWINFLYVNGVVGVSIYLIIIISRINSVNKWPLFLLVLGGFHYAAIFSMPAGQLLFAYCLALSPQPVENTVKGGVVHVS